MLNADISKFAAKSAKTDQSWTGCTHCPVSASDVAGSNHQTGQNQCDMATYELEMPLVSLIISFFLFSFLLFFHLFFFDQRIVRTFRCGEGEPHMASWAKTHPIDAVLNQLCRDFRRNGTWESAFLPRLFMHTLTLLTWICSILFCFSSQCPVFILFCFFPRAVDAFVATFLLHAERSSQSVLCNPAKPTANVPSTNPPKLALSIYDLRHVESFLSFFIFHLYFYAQCRDIFATFF